MSVMFIPVSFKDSVSHSYTNSTRQPVCFRIYSDFMQRNGAIMLRIIQ